MVRQFLDFRDLSTNTGSGSPSISTSRFACWYVRPTAPFLTCTSTVAAAPRVPVRGRRPCCPHGWEGLPAWPGSENADLSAFAAATSAGGDSRLVLPSDGKRSRRSRPRGVCGWSPGGRDRRRCPRRRGRRGRHLKSMLLEYPGKDILPACRNCRQAGSRARSRSSLLPGAVTRLSERGS